MTNLSRGVQSLYDFLDAFNTAEKDQIIKHLHFPHVTQVDGGGPLIYVDEESFATVLEVQLKRMVEVERWSHSSLDRCQIINETDHMVQCAVEFSRRLKDGSIYGCAKGVWIATLINDKWALQLRSMIPISGIALLAGTKINNGSSAK